ncbi:hypothetical protein ACFX12_030840 [Malus domestica]
MAVEYVMTEKAGRQSDVYIEGKVIEAADPKLCGDFDEKQIECLMIIGLWCAHPDYNFRPSIQQAIQVLNFEVPLPIFPSEMPVAIYFTFASIILNVVPSDSSAGSEGHTESSANTYSISSSYYIVYLVQ